MQESTLELFNSSGCEIPTLNLRGLAVIVKEIYIDNAKSFEWINVILMTNEEHTTMNREYLNHDYPTDILTFPFEEQDSINGELYINPFVAKENALNYQGTLYSELCRLIIHGALHLVGFNDLVEEGKKEMKRLEDFYINKLTE